MSVNDNDLFDIVRSVWSTVVSGSGAYSRRCSRDDINSEFLCAWMEASGARNGGLLLSCQESLAREAASIASATIACCEDAVHDTFGELANMIAGPPKFCSPRQPLSNLWFSKKLNSQRLVKHLASAQHRHP